MQSCPCPSHMYTPHARYMIRMETKLNFLSNSCQYKTATSINYSPRKLIASIFWKSFVCIQRIRITKTFWSNIRFVQSFFSSFLFLSLCLSLSLSFSRFSLHSSHFSLCNDGFCYNLFDACTWRCFCCIFFIAFHCNFSRCNTTRITCGHPHIAAMHLEKRFFTSSNYNVLLLWNFST